MSFPFKPPGIVKNALIMCGAFIVMLIALFIYVNDRIAHSQDAGEPERVAAQIVNFKVPEGFRLANGLDLPIMKQVTLISVDPKIRMTISLQGIYASATAETMDQSVGSAIQSRCAKHTSLGDELLTANGALLTLHRFLCVGAAGGGGKGTLEYEFGSFAGKAPIVTVAAFAPQSAWNPDPLRALLRSMH